MIDEAAKVGLESASVSIDGIGRTHDRLRGKRGAFESGMQAFALLREAGVYVGFNSQINRENLGEIDALANLTIEKDAAAWQVALTVAMGNAADRPELLLQPYDVLEVIPALAQAATKLREQGKLLYPGNNVGYFGPHEHALRGSTSCGHYGGCGAGRSTLGIEANGNVKGCPSLPSADWVGGNLREHRLATIWGRAHALRYTRTRTKAALWGFCGSCYYAESCMGGCTWTSHSLLGRPGNNPYCYHRADALMKSGERERIELVERPSGLPFDHGLYSLTLEPWCEPSLSPHQKN
jgi:radical SAM protein with 4Fe4S-binding SPASM domain